MTLLKKVFIGLALICVFYLGGEGAQSQSLVMQGLGFVGLLIGLIILYKFGKMVLRGLGCLMTFLILSAIVGFIMYAFGLFNNGLSGVPDSVMGFIGMNRSRSVAAATQTAADLEPAAELPAAEEEMSARLYEDPEPAPKPKNETTAEPARQVFNPHDFPSVQSSVRIISADTLEIQDHRLRLFGVDGPEIGQTCADNYGRSYNCGQQAINWLKGWIQDNQIECHIIGYHDSGYFVGTCNFGPYDIGAALVNAGWAIARQEDTGIYVPYEEQARIGRRGLWQGTFYTPEDWRRIKSRKATIKIIKPRKRLKGIFG